MKRREKMGWLLFGFAQVGFIINAQKLGFQWFYLIMWLIGSLIAVWLILAEGSE